MHGLRRIPSDVVESGQMCGATGRQRFWWVEVPTALPQIMVGVNQTTMAALSMVIIAAIWPLFMAITCQPTTEVSPCWLGW